MQVRYQLRYSPEREYPTPPAIRGANWLAVVTHGWLGQ